MKTLLTLLAIIALPAAGLCKPAGDVTAPIRQFLDGFNTNDTSSAYAAFAAGDISILDEFPPHRWIGPHAPQQWAADYETNAQKIGVTDGSVSYGKPLRTEIEAGFAYVIIPAVYSYKSHGVATREEAQMTFALSATHAGWKINAWAFTGVTPHAAR